MGFERMVPLIRKAGRDFIVGIKNRHGFSKLGNIVSTFDLEGELTIQIMSIHLRFSNDSDSVHEK
jgi:hypothetical protein